MNLGPIVAWGSRTLEILESPPTEVLQWCSPQRLEEKFGWLREYRESLVRWSQWLELVTVAEQHVRREGLTSSTAVEVCQQLVPLATTGSGVRLAAELITFVSGQCQPIPDGERLVGTTESLECAFGKQKSLERSATKTGFTSLVLALGAVVGKTTAEVIHCALESCRTKHVRNWCREHLGITLQSKRRIAYARDKKPDEKTQLST